MKPPIQLKSCPKRYTKDLDKADDPAQTVQRVKNILETNSGQILLELKRVDVGRLGIPVYMSMAGAEASKVLSARKQMGKGASPDQAKASALMELVERYSFFSFFQDNSNFVHLTYSEATAKFGQQVISLEEIFASVHETGLDPKQALTILDLVRWKFAPTLELASEQTRYIPCNWFKLLNEYNGSAAGNSLEEAILQGGCELVERHVCAEIAHSQPVLPSIDPKSFTDPTLIDLYKKFESNGIKLWLKDFSLGFPVPTVGVLAYDPKTFPEKSEIVFTAGTSTSPQKAAIRALTEVAQLAGDFITNSCYEPSGLPKYKNLDEIKWIMQGRPKSILDLPNLAEQDFYLELKALAKQLQAQGFNWYSLNLTHSDLKIPVVYNVIAGLKFWERSKALNLGMVVGRIIAEQEEPNLAKDKLKTIAQFYPNAQFVPFFYGLLALRNNELERAQTWFEQASKMDAFAPEKALSLFYLAYVLSLLEKWTKIPEILDEAIGLAEVKEYFNLQGVAWFKLGKYEQALVCFEKALNLDKGSAVDLANVGICYLRLGNEQKGILALEQALELDPGLDFARAELEKILAKF